MSLPLIATLKSHRHEVTAITFSPNGRLMGSGGGYRDNTIRLWEIGAWKELCVLRGHKGRITSLSFNASSTLIASGGKDKSVKLWDVTAAKLCGTLAEHAAIVFDVAFSPIENEVASCAQDGSALVTDVSTLSTRLRLEPRSGSVLSLSYSPDGATLASGGGTERSREVVQLWDAKSGNLQSSLTGHSDWVLGVRWSHDGTRIASWSYGEILLRTVQSAMDVYRIEKTHGSIVAVAISPDGQTIASGGWMFPSGPDGRPEYLTAIGGIQLWDSATGKLQDEFVAHDKPVTGVAYSMDGGFLATSSQDGTLKIWKTRQ